MALFTERPQVSLISGQSLPQARATSARPDFSGMIRAGNSIMSAGAEEDAAKKRQDDALAGAKAGSAFVGKNEDGSYNEIELPDGSPAFRAAWQDAATNNLDSSIQFDLQAHLNKIQSDPDKTWQQKAELMTAAVETTLENAPASRRSVYKDWASRELVQRVGNMQLEEGRRIEDNNVRGLATTIKSDLDEAQSAAAAGLPVDSITARIDKNIDTLVGLNRMDAETAKIQKANARQLITGQALSSRLITAMRKGEVDVDELDTFGTSIKTGGEAKVSTRKAYQVGPGASSVVEQSYDVKDVLKKIPDPELRNQVSIQITQAANDYRQRVAEAAKGKVFIDQLKLQDSPEGRNILLPTNMHDDADRVGLNMLADKDFYSPKGDAAIAGFVGATGYIPDPIVKSLVARMKSNDPAQVDGAVRMWQAIKSAKNRWGDERGIVAASKVTEEDANLLDMMTFARANNYDPVEANKALNDLKGSRNLGIDQLIKDYNETIGDESKTFEKTFRQRWDDTYGGLPDPKAQDSFVKAYRLGVAITGDPVKAYDQAWSRMTEVWQKNPIFVTGTAQTGRAPLTNPVGHQVDRMTRFGGPAPGTEYEWVEDDLRGDLAMAMKDLVLPPGYDMDAALSPPKTFFAQQTPDFLGRTVKLDPVPGSNPDAPQYMIRLYDEQGFSQGVVMQKGPDGASHPFLYDPHLRRAQYEAAGIAQEQKLKQEKTIKDLTETKKLRLDELMDRTLSKLSLEDQGKYMEGMPFGEYLGGMDPEIEKEYRLEKMQIEDGFDKTLEELNRKPGVTVPAAKVDQQSLLMPKAAGFHVAAAAVRAIDDVLPDGTGGTFMMRVAAQESAFGTVNGSFRSIGDKGMWQVNTGSAFKEVQRRVQSGEGAMAKGAELLKNQLGIDVATATEQDLDKPLVAAAFARLYMLGQSAPIPTDVEGQAAYWKTHYNTYAGAGTVDQFIRNASKVPDSWQDSVKGPQVAQAPGSAKVQLVYSNQNAKRSLPVTPTLEAKLTTAVADVFGAGYKVEVFSGGQHEGESNGVTGTRRHNDGRAGDVYIIAPSGKRVTDTAQLLRLKRYWVRNGFGSVGTFMAGKGMHLDEITTDQLRRGEALTWNY